MRFFDWFKKKTSVDIENEMTEEVIRENEEYLNENTPEILPVSVIRYLKDDDDSAPQIEILCEQFHGPMLPEPGSIIWIADDYTRTSRPYKCIRYDFFESDDEYERSRSYIVVQCASSSEVMPNPKFVAS